MNDFRGIVAAFQIDLKDGKVGSGRTFSTYVHNKAIPKFWLVGAACMDLLKNFCTPSVEYLNVVIECSTNRFDFEDIIVPIVIGGEWIENQICRTCTELCLLVFTIKPLHLYSNFSTSYITYTKEAAYWWWISRVFNFKAEWVARIGERYRIETIVWNIYWWCGKQSAVAVFICNQTKPEIAQLIDWMYFNTHFVAIEVWSIKLV